MTDLAEAAAPAIHQARAVIFDCDGTLADSEPLCARAWTRLLSRWEYEPTVQDLRECLGISFAASRDHYAGHIATLPSVEELYPHYWAHLRALYTEELRPFEDATALLDNLVRGGIPVAIASSSDRERLDLTLRLIGLARMIQASVAGDEVAHAKPAPDLFLAAAALLGIPPADCLVIEDSQAGVDAARTAGMQVVTVPQNSRGGNGMPHGCACT